VPLHEPSFLAAHVFLPHLNPASHHYARPCPCGYVAQMPFQLYPLYPAHASPSLALGAGLPPVCYSCFSIIGLCLGLVCCCLTIVSTRSLGVFYCVLWFYLRFLPWYIYNIYISHSQSSSPHSSHLKSVRGASAPASSLLCPVFLTSLQPCLYCNCVYHRVSSLCVRAC
jgi:hypothetical protein